MGAQVEILFPLYNINDPAQRVWYVDGGANQSWSPIDGSGGTLAPGALPHQIGTDTKIPGVLPPSGCCGGCCGGCCAGPPPPAPPLCLDIFDWKSSYITDNGMSPVNSGSESGFQGQVNQLDLYGNFYQIASAKTVIFNPSGSVIVVMTSTDLANGIDAWFGSTIVNRGTGYTANQAFYATPILQGQYIFAYLRAGHSSSDFAHWWVILQPSHDGAPTILGAVYTVNLLGPPYVGGMFFLGITNSQTINDPILFRSGIGFGGETGSLGLVPSIHDITSATYHAGWPGYTAQPCRVPSISYHPIGNNNLSDWLFLSTVTNDYLGFYNSRSGFLLPDSSGGTNLYFYMSHTYMDHEATHPTGASITSEVHNVLQPAYPDGCLIRIKMGEILYHDVATYAFSHAGAANATGTGGYTVDNTSWTDGSLPQIPFTDEYTYLSNDHEGGKDCYILQPGAVLDRGGGKWWIIFYMPGIFDNVANCPTTNATSAQPLYERIRIFEYDTATEAATQILKETCALYTNADIPIWLHGVGSLTHAISDLREWTQAISVSEVGNRVTVHINGFRQDSSFPAGEVTYKVDFCEFTPP